MRYFDFHCDTLMWTHTGGSDTFFSNESTHLDLKRMQAGDYLGQFFAIYMLDEATREKYDLSYLPDDEYIDKLVYHLSDEISKHSDIIQLAYTAEDVLKNCKEQKMSALLTIEDGRALTNDLNRLDEWYKKGLRLVTLLWNHENCLGYPHHANLQLMKKGLKPFGKEVIEKMNDLGIIIDVSHLSDGGFYDVADISTQPFVASHSNARALTPHTRNLTDEMIRVIADSGGVIGLNFAPQFLDETGTGTQSKLRDIVRHANYIKSIGGEDILVLGSDFDGVTGDLEITGAQDMSLLFDELKEAGWTVKQLDKLANENLLRLMTDVL